MSEFKNLMDGVKAGSEEAAWELLNTYGPHIIRVIRRTLSQDIRTRYDSADFAQVVWASFFNHRGDVGRFNTPEELVRFLSGITRNKLRFEFRRNCFAEKRSLDREKTHVGALQSDYEPASPDPTPSAFAIAREKWNQLSSGLSDRDRMILNLRYQGYSNLEIAEKVDVTPKTVSRVVGRLMEKITP